MVGSSSAYNVDQRGPQIYNSATGLGTGASAASSLTQRSGDLPIGMLSGTNAGSNMALDERNRESRVGPGAGLAIVLGVPQAMPMPMLLQTYQQSEQLHMLHTQQHLRLQEAQLQEKLNLVQRQRRMQQNLIAATQQFTNRDPHLPQQQPLTQTLNTSLPSDGCNTEGTSLAVAPGIPMAVVSGTASSCPSSELIDLSNAESSDEEIAHSADIVPYRAEGLDEEVRVGEGVGEEERGIANEPREVASSSLLTAYGAPLLPSLPSLTLNSTMRGHFEAAVPTAYPAKGPSRSAAVSAGSNIADLKTSKVPFEPFTFPAPLPLPIASPTSSSSYHPILLAQGEGKRDAVKGAKHPSYWGDSDKTGAPSLRMGVDVSGLGMERALEAAQIALNRELHGKDPGAVPTPTSAPPLQSSTLFLPNLCAPRTVTDSSVRSERDKQTNAEGVSDIHTHVLVATTVSPRDYAVDSSSNVGSNPPTVDLALDSVGVNQSTAAGVTVQHETPPPHLNDSSSVVTFIPIPIPTPPPAPSASPSPSPSLTARGTPDPFLVAMMRRRMTEEMQNPPVVKSFDPPGTTGKKVNKFLVDLLNLKLTS